jgi:D-alanyl-D-alanine carboxypeptidase
MNAGMEWRKHLMVRLRFVVAVLFLPGALVLGACSESNLSAPEVSLEDRLELALTTGFASSGGKGVSITILAPGKAPWTGVAGVSHGEIPIHQGSVFAAGSITKTFTALTILRLAEEGLLSLDDSLHAWLPEYPHVDPNITLRQVLNHTSGLSDFVDVPGWFSWVYAEAGKAWGMEEFLLETIRLPYFEKGTAWSYSSTGYLLLRMIIEEATGSTVAEQYREHVIEPLGLTATYTVPGDDLPRSWAHGWFDLNGDGTYDDFHTVDNTAFCTAAGGQVYTTSGDLARLAKALMHDRTLLEPATYAEMTDFFFPSGHDEPMVYGYGLGLMWFHESFTFGHTMWGHGGNAPGYAAGMLYLPDHGVVIGIMDNTEEGEAMDVLEPILDALMDHI